MKLLIKLLPKCSIIKIEYTRNIVAHFIAYSYCLSEEDKVKEAKLMKVQERYVPRERSSHCSTYETPSKELKKIQQRRLLLSDTKGLTNDDNKSHEDVIVNAAGTEDTGCTEVLVSTDVVQTKNSLQREATPHNEDLIQEGLMGDPLLDSKCMDAL